MAESPRFVFEDTTPAKGEGRYEVEATKPVDESAGGILTGSLKDTFSLSDRPGAKTTAQVLTRPETPLDYAIQTAVTAPTIALGGAGLGNLAARVAPRAIAAAAPAVGRIATSAGIGAGQAAARGEDATIGGLIDAAVAAVGEGVAGAAGKVASKVAEPVLSQAAGLKYATEAPGKAYEFLKDRLPTGKWLSIPSMDTAKLSFEEAVKKLATMTGDAYRVARAELAGELSRLDIQRVTGPKPLAGSVFRGLTSDQRREMAASPFRQFAAGLMRLLQNEGARGAMDAAMIAPAPEPAPPVPMGALATKWAADAVGGLLPFAVRVERLAR